MALMFQVSPEMSWKTLSVSIFIVSFLSTVYDMSIVEDGMEENVLNDLFNNL